MKIYKWFEFDASHRLNIDLLSKDENKEVFGKCNNTPSHGHTYKLKVVVEGRPNDYGMIINYNDISKVVKPLIEILDHNFLNDLELFNSIPCTTTELMIQVLWDYLEPKLPGLYKLELKETDKTGCTYTGEMK